MEGNPSWLDQDQPHERRPAFHRLFQERVQIMATPPLPASADLARYFEARGELGKPWTWHLLRLAKLREAKDDLDADDYLQRLHDAHADLMRLGEFWQGREAEVFGGRYSPSNVIEPLPGSPDDR